MVRGEWLGVDCEWVSDGWMDEWMSGWMNEWVDGWMNEYEWFTQNDHKTMTFSPKSVPYRNTILLSILKFS